MFYIPPVKQPRPDKSGPHRSAFEKAKKQILREQDTCGICGRPVDKSLKFPDPMSATVDHIIPVDKGGHPSDPSNLQLAHFICNRRKSDKLQGEGAAAAGKKHCDNRELPLTFNWTEYRS